MNSQQEFVLRTVEERDIRFVRLWFTDILGYLKSVAVVPAELETPSGRALGSTARLLRVFRAYPSPILLRFLIHQRSS